MQEDVLKNGGAQRHNETACIDREFIRLDSSVNCEEKKNKKKKKPTEGRDYLEGEANRGSEMVRWRIIGKQSEKWNGRKRTIFMHVTLWTDD